MYRGGLFPAVGIARTAAIPIEAPLVDAMGGVMRRIPAGPAAQEPPVIRVGAIRESPEAGLARRRACVNTPNNLYTHF